MNKQEFINKYHLASPEDQGQMIYDLFNDVLKAVGNQPIEPEKPRYEWDECDLRSTDIGGRIVACIYCDFPGDIEATKADILARAEAGAGDVAGG